MNGFYDDYRLLSFEAEVVDVLEENGKYWIGTATSSFYVEGGGMDKDEGLLNSLPVLDVKFQDRLYYHLVCEKLSGKVRGEVDYENRLKKVQIHTAQHLVSAVLYKNYGMQTLSHHVSVDSAEIVLGGSNNNVDFEKLSF